MSEQNEEELIDDLKEVVKEVVKDVADMCLGCDMPFFIAIELPGGQDVLKGAGKPDPSPEWLSAVDAAFVKSMATTPPALAKLIDPKQNPELN